MVQLPFIVMGTACLALDPLLARRFRVDLGVLGGVLWTVGVAVFVGSIVLTIAEPLRRGTTGTGDHNADRRPLDRFTNRFVPIVLCISSPVATRPSPDRSANSRR